MRVIRYHQTAGALFILAFSALALGIVPTALCCQAMVTASGSEEACPHRGADGEACPLHQPKPVPDGPSHCPTLTSCSTDSLLGSLIMLTGAMPEPVSEAGIHVDSARMPARGEPAPLDDLLSPHVPPPRA